MSTEFLFALIKSKLDYIEMSDRQLHGDVAVGF